MPERYAIVFAAQVKEHIRHLPKQHWSGIRRDIEGGWSTSPAARRATGSGFEVILPSKRAGSSG